MNTIKQMCDYKSDNRLTYNGKTYVTNDILKNSMSKVKMDCLDDTVKCNLTSNVLIDGASCRVRMTTSIHHDDLNIFKHISIVSSHGSLINKAPKSLLSKLQLGSGNVIEFKMSELFGLFKDDVSYLPNVSFIITFKLKENVSVTDSYMYVNFLHPNPSLSATLNEGVTIQYDTVYSFEGEAEEGMCEFFMFNSHVKKISVLTEDVKDWKFIIEDFNFPNFTVTDKDNFGKYPVVKFYPSRHVKKAFLQTTYKGDIAFEAISTNGINLFKERTFVNF